MCIFLFPVFLVDTAADGGGGGGSPSWFGAAGFETAITTETDPNGEVRVYSGTRQAAPG